MAPAAESGALGPEAEGRSPAQPLGRRPVLEDQLPDGRRSLGTGKLLRPAGAALIPNDHLTPGVGDEVAGPISPGIAGSHQEAAIGRRDEADGGGHGPARPATPGDEDRRPPFGSQLGSQGVHRLGHRPHPVPARPAATPLMVSATSRSRRPSGDPPVSAPPPVPLPAPVSANRAVRSGPAPPSNPPARRRRRTTWASDRGST